MNGLDLSAEDVAAGASPALPQLSVRSWFVDGLTPHAPKPFVQGLPTSATEFLAQLPPSGFSCWVRGTSGIVGLGRRLRLRAHGPDRFARLAEAWRALASAATIDNEVGLHGSGLVGFSAIAFADDSAASSVIDVPRFVMGRRDGRVWLTEIEAVGEDADEAGGTGSQAAGPGYGDSGGLVLETVPLSSNDGARLHPGRVTPEDYRRIVAAAVQRLGGAGGLPGGEDSSGDEGSPGDDGSTGDPLRKIVLARDEVVTTPEEIDVRTLLGRLNAEYPGCWTFDVAGLVGATPELLVGVADGQVSSRVLAGTYRVADDAATEITQARSLLGSAKDSHEHGYAIRSLAEMLTPLVDELHVDGEPHLLQLANVIHLASDAHGALSERPDGTTPNALEVAAAVHPTAAVGGTPRDAALAAIGELEGADRGRYAGPVGWLDDRGNGQFGIALRCGQLEERNAIRIFAGAGIMPDSDPDVELAETEAKLAPMKRALGVSAPRA